MFDNTIFINNTCDNTYNFKKHLNKNNTLVFTDCKNINIKIKSKINKIIIEKCSNINIKIGDAIIGIEILKSKDINIKIYKNKKINCLELFNSNIKINKLNYILINENSNIKY